MRNFKPNALWLPDSTWSNHYALWDHAGAECRAYPYYGNATQSLDLDGMIDVLSSQAQRGDATDLHACAHNPTGTGPTKDQWEQVAHVCKRLNLFVLFDSSISRVCSRRRGLDAWAIRYFFRQKPPLNLCVAQSFSKTLAVWTTCGRLSCRSGNDFTRGDASALSQLTYLIRAEYSMALRWGCTIVKRVFHDLELRQEWMTDLVSMSDRTKSMRTALHRELLELQTPGSWNHLLR
jgi:aspartate aminotransferase, cytoplasmic